jgi:hypothetical protein
MPYSRANRSLNAIIGGKAGRQAARAGHRDLDENLMFSIC